MGEENAFFKQQESKERKALIRVMAFNSLIVIGFAILIYAFLGCAAKQVKYEQYPMHGKCFWFDRIENETAGYTYCRKAVRVKSGLFLVCTRKVSHRGRCHNHDEQNCRWTWR